MATNRFIAKNGLDNSNQTITSVANGVNTTDVATIGQLNAKANLDSPTFTGNPAAPTPTLGDNDTSIATTAFVQSAITAGVDKEIFDGNGVHSGMKIIPGTTGTFTIEPGEYHTISNGDVTYAGSSNIPVTDIITQEQTFIMLRVSDGVIVQQSTKWAPAQRRTHIILGILVHTDNVNINAINNLPDVANYSLAQLNDLICSLKNFNISGNVISPNGTNLSINKSLGEIFKRGSNFEIDPNDPHTKTMDALVAPNTIRLRMSNGVETANTNVLSLQYESPLGTLQNIDNGYFGVFRVVLFSSNLIRIQYPQFRYQTMAEAQAAIASESYITESNIASNGLLRGYIIVRGGTGTTALNDPARAKFVQADRWGEMPFGGSGGGIATLQSAYDNSIEPEILTNSSLGAVTIKRGSTLDTDNVLEIKNGSNVVTANITGEGSANFTELKVDNVLTVNSTVAGIVTLDSTGDDAIAYEIKQQTVNKLVVYKDGSASLPDCLLTDITDDKDIATKEYVDQVNGEVSQLHLGTEGLNTGWWLEGDNRDNKGPIGSNAIDLSFNTSASTTHGATAIYSFATGQQTIASGSHSTAEGFNTIASQHAAHAEGASTTASGTVSHAEGQSTIASGTYSHAEGQSTKAIETISHAEGSATIANGTVSHSEGSYTIAIGTISHAEGEETFAIGAISHAEGYQTKTGYTFTVIDSSTPGELVIAGDQTTFVIDNQLRVFRTTEKQIHYIQATDILSVVYTAPNTIITYQNNSLLENNTTYVIANADANMGLYSHAEGQSTIAAGSMSHAEGGWTKATANGSHAEGSGTTASGTTAHSEGSGTTASGYASHSEGSGTTASGEKSHAEGLNTQATSVGSHSEGSGTISSNSSTHAEGTNTQATQNSAHSEGVSTIASNTASHAEGNSTTASGPYSHSEGDTTVASGNATHSEGNGTTASGNYSHAEGISTTATGSGCHSEGDGTIAKIHASHAEGHNTEANANASHAEGYLTKANGDSSHAEGNNTIASGTASHAEGIATTAGSSFSHAEGYDNEILNTAPSGAHVEGKFAIAVDAPQQHVVGIGVDDANRANGFVVETTGKVLAPSLTTTILGAEPSGSKCLVTKEYVDQFSDVLTPHVADLSIHREQDDSLTTTQNLWSAQKIQDKLDTKSDTTHTHTLDFLSDVSISLPSDGQVLTYNSATGDWVNGGGGGVGSSSGGGGGAGTVETTNLTSANGTIDFGAGTTQLPYYSFFSVSADVKSLDKIRFYVDSVSTSITFSVAILEFNGTDWNRIAANNNVVVTTAGFQDVSITGINLISGNKYAIGIIRKTTGTGTCLIAYSQSLLSNTIGFNGAAQTSTYEIVATETTKTASNVVLWFMLYSSDGGDFNSYTTTTKIANYTAVRNNVILCNTSAGGFTITLPLASENKDKVMVIKKITNDSNVVLVDPQGSETIDGDINKSLSEYRTAFTVISDGSNWWVI